MEKLRRRAAELAAARAAAQATLNKAVAARQAHLIDGDISDDKIRGRLQTAVSDALSTLEGYDDAIADLNTKIRELDAKLAAERSAAERLAASEALQAKVDVVEGLLPNWLEATRALAAALELLPATEAQQMAGYTRSAASEIENAAAMLRSGWQLLLSRSATGGVRIPRPPSEVVAFTPPAPAPTTMRLFLTQPLAWYDENGEQHRAPSMNNAEIPLRLVAKAGAIGAAHTLDSPERKKLHGTKTSAPPEWSWCKWLNEDPRIKSMAAPILHSAFEKPAGRVGTMSRPPPAEPMPRTGTRTMDDGEI